MYENLLTIGNEGGEIVDTNFYDSLAAEHGKVFLSTNAGVSRLMVPDCISYMVAEMKTSHEVIISRGAWPEHNLADAIEILFEDGSNCPFVLQICLEQLDRIPSNSDVGQKYRFAVYTRAGKQLELPCYYRKVKSLPYLKSYTGKR